MKNSIWVVKSAEVDADFESVEKIAKKSMRKKTEKVLEKKSF
jgi:hypothetical protein